MPIRVRVTLLFAVVLAAVLAATGAFVYMRLRADLRGATDAALRSRAEVLTSRLGSLGESRGLIEAEEAFAQLVDPAGRVLDSSAILTPEPILPEETLADVREPTFFDVPVRTTEEVELSRILAVPTAEGPVLLVGASLEERQETLASLARLLAVGGPVALLLATGAVWLLVRTALRPVDRMREEAEAVSISDPGRRLPVPGTRDEIERLGASLNRMLERLQDALSRERRFVDDASHELRTPVAALKAELELALSRARTPEELEAAVRRGAADAGALARLTEDLLVLARADRGRLPIRREDVDLGELAEQLAGGFEARAREAGVELDVRVEGSAELDPLRLRQVLTNLLDNAIRYTPRDGRVTLTTSREDGDLVIAVADTGPGFSQDVLARPFEPFARADTERGRPEGGAGLGLAIVRAVMEAHGGSASIENGSSQGARVSLRFPGA